MMKIYCNRRACPTTREWIVTRFGCLVVRRNVSNVEDFSEALDDAEKFNEDIQFWHVSHVGNLAYMFASARKFNQELSSWNAFNVTTMRGMFYEVTAWSQNLSAKGISTVVLMFKGATAFHHDVVWWGIHWKLCSA
jgi:hypothetical protein